MFYLKIKRKRRNFSLGMTSKNMEKGQKTQKENLGEEEITQKEKEEVRTKLIY